MGSHTTLDTDALRARARAVLDGAQRCLLGKQDVCAQVLAALLAGGHVLLEDMPGVGKTTLALAIARLTGLGFGRLQLTPDVMPADIVGFSAWEPGAGGTEGRLAFHPGAVFCNLLLADELNRTSPKTQSALLEAMEERAVSADGVTRPLPDPFAVIATQNPLGSAGTQPLPLSQLDRFCVSLSLGYPSLEAEIEMARGASAGRRVDALEPACDAAAFRDMRATAQTAFVHEAVLDYLVRLVAATRESPLLEAGASPRATLDLVRLARSCAWLEGQDYVSPAHVARMFAPCVRHRVSLARSARAEGTSVAEALAQVLASVARPRVAGR